MSPQDLRTVFAESGLPGASLLIELRLIKKIPEVEGSVYTYESLGEEGMRFVLRLPDGSATDAAIASLPAGTSGRSSKPSISTNGMWTRNFMQR